MMTKDIDDYKVNIPYEDTLSIEQLRSEARQLWDFQRDLSDALKNLPEMPPPSVLLELSNAARYPEDHEIGKRLQRDRRDLNIPFKSEYEGGAGIWFRMRKALLEI